MAAGTKADPWVLETPPGTSDYMMYKDEDADPPALVCQVGSTTLKYQLRAIDGLPAWLREQGDWVALGAADEQKPAAEGTVEATGMACARANAAASACTCHHYVRHSGSPNPRTTRETTGCEQSDEHEDHPLHDTCSEGCAMMAACAKSSPGTTSSGWGNS